MNAVIRAKRDLIFSVSVFGTIGIFVRWIGLPSSVIALVRGAVGAAFLLLLARFRHAPIDRAALRRRWQLLLLSAAMMSFNWITLFEAYRYTTVATATLCYYMAPIFVTLISPVLLKERLTARKLLCVFLALAGMVFVSGVPQSGLPGPSEAKGILLALCSAALYAATLYTPSIRKRGLDWVMLPLAVLISISTVFVKQHSCLDILGAIPYSALVWWLVYGVIFKKKKVK